MDDLISRQAAIDALHQWFADGFEEDRWWNSTHVLAALEGLPSAELEQQWIPCSERLPEDERRVLILNDDNLYMIGFVKETDWGKEWRYQFDMYDDDVYEEEEQGKIIAWRSLPKPYQEEK